MCTWLSLSSPAGPQLGEEVGLPLLLGSISLPWAGSVSVLWVCKANMTVSSLQGSLGSAIYWLGERLLASDIQVSASSSSSVKWDYNSAICWRLLWELNQLMCVKPLNEWQIQSKFLKGHVFTITFGMEKSKLEWSESWWKIFFWTSPPKRSMNYFLYGPKLKDEEDWEKSPHDGMMLIISST